MSKHTSPSTIHDNKKARFDYEIIETFEAGIILSGAEVKSIRSGNVGLKGSHVSLGSGRPMLLGSHVGQLKNLAPGTFWNPTKERILLLKKKTVTALQTKIREKGMTLIATRIYFKGTLIKVEVALARGRTNYDKRHVLKNRVLEREADRAMKQRMR